MENMLSERTGFPFFVFRSFKILGFGGLCCLSILLAACGQLEKPKTEPLYAETPPPDVKEFRWSNGKLPKSFDPARAAAPPETDVVRAVYEGLTDTNAKTLETVPAIAAAWSASKDYRTWTFKLRRDAKWSNDERITANDFVRSWKRLAAFGEKIPHFQLFSNIAGMRAAKTENDAPKTPAEIDFLARENFAKTFPPAFERAENNNGSEQIENNSPVAPQPPIVESTPPVEPKPPAKIEQKSATTQPQQKFGVEAVDDFTLKISLEKPDKDFPALAAHPLFRPVYGDGKYFDDGKLNQNIVTSGAFRVSNVAPDGLTLLKSENFYDKNRVELERVRFVPMQNAEKALAAYRGGEIDAVTNVEFEPLAMKLLTPFDDFRRAAHSALNFYEINAAKAPFDDRRVREALAISVERERIAEDEMDSASSPAFGFSPFGDGKNPKLAQDVERAQNLLAEAGFPNGENFPEIRLVVNRNDLQQRVARAVAKMWKKNLNVATSIIVKEAADFEIARKTRDFDVLRRGVVLPTTDETVNMLAVFSPHEQPESADLTENALTQSEPTPASLDVSDSENTNSEIAASENPSNEKTAQSSVKPATENTEILTEKDALARISAIPLYFPTSYSLVKSYIRGFEINTLDAPSLKDVKIDNNWQPKKPRGES